jgi:hypothetical protein
MPLIPLTDDVLNLLDSPSDIDRAERLVKEYGAKIGRAIDADRLEPMEGCRLMAAYSDGISAALDLGEHMASVLRNAAFAAADFTQVTLAADREANAS